MANFSGWQLSVRKLTGFKEIVRKCCLDFGDVPDYQLDPGMF